MSAEYDRVSEKVADQILRTRGTKSDLSSEQFTAQLRLETERSLRVYRYRRADGLQVTEITAWARGGVLTDEQRAAARHPKSSEVPVSARARSARRLDEAEAALPKEFSGRGSPGHGRGGPRRGVTDTMLP